MRLPLACDCSLRSSPASLAEPRYQYTSGHPVGESSRRQGDYQPNGTAPAMAAMRCGGCLNTQHCARDKQGLTTPSPCVVQVPVPACRQG